MFTLFRLLTNISKGCYVKSKPVKSTKVFHNTVLGVPFNYIRKKNPINKQYETKVFNLKNK